MKRLLAAAALIFLPGLAFGQQSPPTGDVAEELPIIEGPQILQYVEAPYPEQAEEMGIQSTVVLIVEIDETGAVTNVTVSIPAGFGFDEAAVAAVQAMTFTPARTEAGPVPVAFEFAYGFVLTPETDLSPEERGEPPPPLPINLDGEVIEMGTRRPIVDARVVVDGTDLVVKTDENGRFELRGVPVGAQKVRVLHTGHVTVDADVEIPEGEVITYRLWMRSESYRDNEVVAVYQREKEEVTRRTITIEEVRRVPGTFGDPIKVIQTLPGAARSPFGTGLLVIRGSNPEDSGVYVDGVRIPIIYHLTGTTSVLSPDLIESVDYLPGAYGVQYGRSMGGVIDVRTKDQFEDGKLVWGTDILDSQLYYEGYLGKKKKHGIAVGARRSYIDAFIPLFTKDSGFHIKPRYVDYQVKWVPELGGGQQLSVFFYGFDDILEIATPEDTSQGSDQDTQGDIRTQYASQRLMATYRRPLGDHLALEVVPSVGIDYSRLGLGNEFSLTSDNFLGELRVELPWKPTEAVEVVPGLDFIAGWGTFEFASPFGFTDLDDPLNEREAVGIDGSVTGWGPDLYLKAKLRPLNQRDRLLIIPGVRANLIHFAYEGGITEGTEGRPWTQAGVDPRLSARLMVIEGASLKASTGIYNQPPQPFEAVGIGVEQKLGFERAWATSIGFEHQLTPSVHWDLDLFYKELSNLVVFNESWGGFGDQNFINAGIGHAYGLEFIARHDPTGRFFGWVSYTLSNSTRQDHPGDSWYTFDLDQTHIFSAQGGYDLPYDFGISAQIQYVTGNPTSTYNAGVYDVDGDFYNGFRIGAYNAERLPPFFQTSVRLDKLWTFKRWQLETYVDLMQVVRGVNPEFTLYAYDYSEFAYVRGLPFIPNIGIEAKFWP